MSSADETCRQELYLTELRMRTRLRALDEARRALLMERDEVNVIHDKVEAIWKTANVQFRQVENMGAITTAYCDSEAPLPSPMTILGTTIDASSLAAKLDPMVSVFKAMKAPAAAGVLQTWPPVMAATVLQRLPARVASKITASLPPALAATLTREIAQGNTLAN